MKNIHLLPTDKPNFGRYLVFNKENTLCIWDTELIGSQKTLTPQHIYITSYEEIKDVRPHKGKWQLEEGEILNKFPNYLTDLSECKLIIMTTDPELIADGVQAIDDEFLEWFVKNPSCEYVEITPNWEFLGDVFRHGGEPTLVYYPTIPQEEPKTGSLLESIQEVTKDLLREINELKQETLEEIPKELEPILAKISHINDLGLSQWYEVVYYADDKWCSYSDSKTFEDGERVIDWKYCKEQFKNK
jgi:hypothetical protein